MPRSGCLALHGVNPIFFKKKPRAGQCIASKLITKLCERLAFPVFSQHNILGLFYFYFNSDK